MAMVQPQAFNTMDDRPPPDALEKGLRFGCGSIGGQVIAIVPGRDGDDVPAYLERQVQQKIKDSQP